MRGIEFPTNYTVILYGPPGVGKFEYCLDMVRFWLEKGENIIFITTERSPEEIKKRADEYGIGIKDREGEQFLFVDSYSWSVGKKYDKGLTIENPANINEISIVIDRAVQSLKKPLRMVFDSLSPLFLYNSPDAMTKFFQVLNSKVKEDYGFILYTLQEGVHDPRVVNTLIYLVDGYLQMKFEEEEMLERKFRIHHLKGMVADPTWRTFKIGEKGFEFV